VRVCVDQESHAFRIPEFRDNPWNPRLPLQ
jgi:hypothetical protein